MRLKCCVITVLAIVCFLPILQSQCPDHDILLQTQAQVDSFQFTYPNCTEFTRTLEVRGPGIHNLQGLHVLEKIRLIEVDGTEIVNLDGLDNVTESENIAISNNPYLVDISAIGQITNLRFAFELINNDAIVDLSGLNLDTVRYCLIDSNDALVSLHGLEKLAFVMYELRIRQNVSLQDLQSLSGLTLAYNEFHIDNNDRLKDLRGLENLQGVGHTFTITRNDSLESLAGLQYIEILDLSHDYFGISGNPQLDSCHTEAMCAYLDGHMVYFTNNGPGCNSVSEVRDLCMITPIGKPDPGSVITVYPNPGRDHLFVAYPETTGPSELRMYDYLGKEVLRENNFDTPVQIGHLPPGYYMLRMDLNGSVYMTSVAKQ